MKLTRYSQLKDGMKVKCKVGEVKITSAKISIDDRGRAFICHNNTTKDGWDVKDKKGYTYSWLIANNGEGEIHWRSMDREVTNLVSVKKTLADAMEGDILVDKFGDERKILAIVGKLYGLSDEGDFDNFCNWWTMKELKSGEYKLKGVYTKVESVKIEGKKYDKEEVIAAIKDLEPIE